MEKNTKNEWCFAGNCCETCCNIPQEIPIKELTKKNSLPRQTLFEMSVATSYK